MVKALSWKASGLLVESHIYSKNNVYFWLKRIDWIIQWMVSFRSALQILVLYSRMQWTLYCVTNTANTWRLRLQTLGFIDKVLSDKKINVIFNKFILRKINSHLLVYSPGALPLLSSASDKPISDDNGDNRRQWSATLNNTQWIHI